ncbi:MAG: hypothetical protein HC915_21560, partial [Anaerolineae bacterium]|nr:hypothetical protein [Anaerolineae bacterium]
AAVPVPQPAGTERTRRPRQPTPPADVETFTLNGTLVNGTAGATAPADLPLTLRVVGLMADGQPQQLYEGQTVATPDGSFSFTDVPKSDRALGVVQTDYAGVRQTSDQFFPAGIEGESFDLTMTIYETTTDSSVIEIDYVESVIDAVTAEGASLTFQFYEFVNTGDRVYIGEEGRTLRILLPAGALAPNVQTSIGDPGERFEIVREEEAFVFYDSESVPPGPFERIAVSYGHPYPGEMSISQRFVYPVLDSNVFIAQPRGLALESDQLQPADSGDFNGMPYLGFNLVPEPLPVGTALSYRIFDGPNAASAAPPVRDVAVSTEEDGATFLSVARHSSWVWA